MRRIYMPFTVLEGVKTISKSDRRKLQMIDNIISNNYRVSDRIISLKKKGYRIENMAMGSGGVGQIQFRRIGMCIQVSYGVSRHNYAFVVVL